MILKYMSTEPSFINNLTQTVLDDGSRLLNDLTEDLLAVHKKLLDSNKKYNGSDAFVLYTKTWLPTVKSLCDKLKAFNDECGAPAVAGFATKRSS